jgi:hypothetical protein
MTTYTSQSAAYGDVRASQVAASADAADAADRKLSPLQARRLARVGMSRADRTRQRQYAADARASLTVRVDAADAADRVAALRARTTDAADRRTALRASQDAATADAADARGTDAATVVADAVATIAAYDLVWRNVDGGRAYVYVPRRDRTAPLTSALRRSLAA